MKTIRTFAGGAVIAVLAGCSEVPKNMPLVFGETITFGVGISGSTADQGVDVTLGLKTKNIAVVPVTMETSGGDRKQLTANLQAGHQDALSTLAQFESKTEAGTTATIGLGKFFATGLAASQLAEGFKYALGGYPPAGAAGEGKPAVTKPPVPPAPAPQK